MQQGMSILFFAPCPPSRAVQARRADLSEKQKGRFLCVPPRLCGERRVEKDPYFYEL